MSNLGNIKRGQITFGDLISPANFLLLISCSLSPNHLFDSSAGVQVLGPLEGFVKHSFSGLTKVTSSTKTLHEKHYFIQC